VPDGRGARSGGEEVGPLERRGVLERIAGQQLQVDHR
jgi:hypothetical protein